MFISIILIICLLDLIILMIQLSSRGLIRFDEPFFSIFAFDISLRRLLWLAIILVSIVWVWNYARRHPLSRSASKMKKKALGEIAGRTYSTATIDGEHWTYVWFRDEDGHIYAGEVYRGEGPDALLERLATDEEVMKHNAELLQVIPAARRREFGERLYDELGDFDYRHSKNLAAAGDEYDQLNVATKDVKRLITLKQREAELWWYDEEKRKEILIQRNKLIAMLKRM